MDNIRVIAEQANSVNVLLEVGGISDTVTVKAAESPIIDTATGNNGSPIWPLSDFDATAEAPRW